MNQPNRAVRVTVAVPVYNSVEFVQSTLSSILNSISVNDEILIVDDGSTDGSWEVCESFARINAQQATIRIFRNDRNIGLFPNWNRCVELAAGEYFKLVCSDDEMLAGYLDAEVNNLQQHRKAAFVNCRGKLMDPNGTELAIVGDEIPQGVYEGSKMIPCLLQFHSQTGWNPFCYFAGILFRTSDIRKVGSFPKSMNKSGDIALIYELLKAGQFVALDLTNCVIRRHVGQAGLAKIAGAQHTKELFQVLDCNADVFDSRREFLAVRDSYCALILFYGAKFLRERNLSGFWNHFLIANENVTTFYRLVFYFFRFVGGKLLEKLIGYKPKLKVKAALKLREVMHQ